MKILVLVLPRGPQDRTCLAAMGEWVGETVGPDAWETCRVPYVPYLIPAGNVFAFLAELFPAEMFTMYPSANGRPNMAPQILAAAITLWPRMGCRISRRSRNYGAACGGRPHAGSALNDMAFDPSLLACFRRCQPLPPARTASSTPCARS
ncbi:hypothetical protein [Streptomyces sp. RP5T]|uniref:hypothetical protein n=1 Tax=Streptomyces sp. RP5T TaxID=2490848 RepID=UPI00163AFC16|nr:hypothetical protein [Streptomyces sp. RP5T]